MSRDDALLDEIRALRADLQRLPEAIAAALAAGFAPSAARSALNDDEEKMLGRLLAGISASFGDATFTIAQLLEHSRFDPALKLALDRVVGEFDSRTARRIGKRLARCEHRSICGYQVRVTGKRRAGAIWQVVAAPRLPHLHDSR